MDEQQQSPLAASVERIRSELDNWMEVAVQQGEKALDKFGLKPTTGVWLPKVDMAESGDEICVWVDLAGVNPADVSVELTGNMLTISGERPETPFAEGSTVHLVERTSGKFQRPIPLPIPVNADDVHAEANNGVLKVTMKKSPEAVARQIPITSEGDAAPEE
ncbi:MAG: hypothetical protein CMJ78_21680 [Planctomycetaceae bacterium]|nr:hypothetical protein [Planctomycetaceae bacterium]